MRHDSVEDVSPSDGLSRSAGIPRLGCFTIPDRGSPYSRKGHRDLRATNSSEFSMSREGNPDCRDLGGVEGPPSVLTTEYWL